MSQRTVYSWCSAAKGETLWQTLGINLELLKFPKRKYSTPWVSRLLAPVSSLPKTLLSRESFALWQKTRLPDMKQKGRMRTTEAPPRWNRFFQQLADLKTALPTLTEMHLPMFKNEECLLPGSMQKTIGLGHRDLHTDRHHHRPSHQHHYCHPHRLSTSRAVWAPDL